MPPKRMCKFVETEQGCLNLKCRFLHPSQGTKRSHHGDSRPSAEKRPKLEEWAEPHTEVILFPDQYTAVLLGTNGATLRYLNENCSAFIEISAKGDLVDGNNRQVTINGHREGINEAKLLLDNVIKEYNIPFHGFETIPPYYANPYLEAQHQEFAEHSMFGNWDGYQQQPAMRRSFERLRHRSEESNVPSSSKRNHEFNQHGMSKKKNQPSNSVKNNPAYPQDIINELKKRVDELEKEKTELKSEIQSAASNHQTALEASTIAGRPVVSLPPGCFALLEALEGTEGSRKDEVTKKKKLDAAGTRIQAEAARKDSEETVKLLKAATQASTAKTAEVDALATRLAEKEKDLEKEKGTVLQLTKIGQKLREQGAAEKAQIKYEKAQIKSRHNIEMEAATNKHNAALALVKAERDMAMQANTDKAAALIARLAERKDSMKNEKDYCKEIEELKKMCEETKLQHKEEMEATMKKRKEETELLQKNCLSMEAERDDMDDQVTALKERLETAKTKNASNENPICDQEEVRLLHDKCSELDLDLKAKDKELQMQNKDIKSKEEASQRKEVENRQLQTKCSELELRLADKTSTLKEQEIKLEASHKLEKEIQTKYSELKHRAKDLNETIVRKLEGIHKLEKDKHESQKTCSELRQAISAKDSELKEQRVSIARKSDTINTLEKTKQELQRNCSEIRQDISVKDSQLHQLETDFLSKENEVKALGETIGNLECSVKQLKEKRAKETGEFRKELKSKDEAIVKLEQNLSSKESEIEAQNRSIKGTEETIHDLESELQSQSKNEKSKEKETQNLESEIKRLIALRDKDLEEFEKEQKSLKAQIDSADKDGSCEKCENMKEEMVLNQVLLNEAMAEQKAKDDKIDLQRKELVTIKALQDEGCNCIELSEKMKKLNKSLKAKKHIIKLQDDMIKTLRLEASDSG